MGPKVDEDGERWKSVDGRVLHSTVEDVAKGINEERCASVLIQTAEQE